MTAALSIRHATRDARKRVDILTSPRDVEAFLARIAPGTRAGPGGPR